MESEETIKMWDKVWDKMIGIDRSQSVLNRRQLYKHGEILQ